MALAIVGLSIARSSSSCCGVNLAPTSTVGSPFPVTYHPPLARPSPSGSGSSGSLLAALRGRGHRPPLGGRAYRRGIVRLRSTGGAARSAAARTWPEGAGAAGAGGAAGRRRRGRRRDDRVAGVQPGQRAPQATGHLPAQPEHVQRPVDAGGVGQAQAQASLPRGALHQDQAQPGAPERGPRAVDVERQQPGGVDVRDAVQSSAGAGRRGRPPAAAARAAGGGWRCRSAPSPPGPGAPETRATVSRCSPPASATPAPSRPRSPSSPRAAPPEPTGPAAPSTGRNHSGQRSWSTSSSQTAEGGAPRMASASMRVTSTPSLARSPAIRCTARPPAPGPRRPRPGFQGGAPACRLNGCLPMGVAGDSRW